MPIGLSLVHGSYTTKLHCIPTGCNSLDKYTPQDFRSATQNSILGYCHIIPAGMSPTGRGSALSFGIEQQKCRKSGAGSLQHVLCTLTLTLGKLARLSIPEICNLAIHNGAQHLSLEDFFRSNPRQVSI